MEKQTKNIITYEEIVKKLCSDNTASLRHTAFVFFVVLLVCGAMSAIFIAAIFEAPNGWFGLIPAFIAAAITVPIWVMLAGFVKDLQEYRHLKSGDRPPKYGLIYQHPQVRGAICTAGINSAVFPPPKIVAAASAAIKHRSIQSCVLM